MSAGRDNRSRWTWLLLVALMAAYGAWRWDLQTDLLAMLRFQYRVAGVVRSTGAARFAATGPRPGA